LLVTERSAVVAELRPLAEAAGWVLIPTQEAGATPEMVACCEMVLVDLALGQGLVRWLAQHAGHRLACLCGSWDMQQQDVADCCSVFVSYPLSSRSLLQALALT
jgi:hypothetical protein